MAKARGFNRAFSELYRNECFAVWELNNHPNMKDLLTMLKPDEEGEYPSEATLTKWKTFYRWEERATDVQLKVEENTDRMLVQTRMEMMKRHAAMAQKIQDMAFDYLKETGFDSSASAVAALFKGFGEEKQSRGMEQALDKVFSMNDEDLQKTMNRLLARAKGLDVDDVDGEVVDAISSEQAPDID